MTRAALRAVEPQTGDYVKVINSGHGCWAMGCHWDGELQGAAPAGMHTVHYLGRFAAMQIEPDWDGDWPAGRVHYRELVPQPRDGQSVLPRNGDGHEWTIHLVLFTVNARAVARDVLTFDAYHLVILYVPPPALPDPPQPLSWYLERERRCSARDLLGYHEQYIEKEARRLHKRAQAHYDERLAEISRHDPKYTRCWIRWCYSSHSFIPVCDPAKLRALAGMLPDAQPDTPLFTEVRK